MKPGPSPPSPSNGRECVRLEGGGTTATRPLLPSVYPHIHSHPIHTNSTQCHTTVILRYSLCSAVLPLSMVVFYCAHPTPFPRVDLIIWFTLSLPTVLLPSNKIHVDRLAFSTDIFFLHRDETDNERKKHWGVPSLIGLKRY